MEGYRGCDGGTTTLLCAVVTFQRSSNHTTVYRRRATSHSLIVPTKALRLEAWIATPGLFDTLSIVVLSSLYASRMQRTLGCMVCIVIRLAFTRVLTLFHTLRRDSL